MEIMEIMAVGSPVIATNVRGNRDLVTDNENGLLVELDDIEGTTKALEALLRSPELRKKMG